MLVLSAYLNYYKSLFIIISSKTTSKDCHPEPQARDYFLAFFFVFADLAGFFFADFAALDFFSAAGAGDFLADLLSAKILLHPAENAFVEPVCRTVIAGNPR